MADLWNYRSDLATSGADLIGYSVEATDGGIGKIDGSSLEAGGTYIVVATGPWIFGKKRMIPAGVVERVDDSNEKVYVDLTKGQIKNAPDFEEWHQTPGTSTRPTTGHWASRPAGTASHPLRRSPVTTMGNLRYKLG